MRRDRKHTYACLNDEKIYLRRIQYLLKLFKCVYDLKQAVMAFWTQLLECMEDMDKKRSTADPCLYFEWAENGLVIIVSWIDDNLIIGNSEAVKLPGSNSQADLNVKNVEN